MTAATLLSSYVYEPSSKTKRPMTIWSLPIVKHAQSADSHFYNIELPLSYEKMEIKLEKQRLVIRLGDWNEWWYKDVDEGVRREDIGAFVDENGITIIIKKKEPSEVIDIQII